MELGASPILWQLTQRRSSRIKPPLLTRYQQFQLCLWILHFLTKRRQGRNPSVPLALVHTSALNCTERAPSPVPLPFATSRNFRFGPSAATWYTLSSPEHNEFTAGRPRVPLRHLTPGRAKVRQITHRLRGRTSFLRTASLRAAHWVRSSSGGFQFPQIGSMIAVRKALYQVVFSYTCKNSNVRLTEKTTIQVTIRPVQLFLVGSPKRCCVSYRGGRVHPVAGRGACSQACGAQLPVFQKRLD